MWRVLLVLVAGCNGCSKSSTATKDAPSASCAAAPPQASGEATYYDATGAGNCSFDASSDRMIAALNAVDYGGSEWCGGCVAVTGPQGSVTVRIVDKCPGCAKGDLDLSREAFAKIAPLSAGRVPITWQLAPCEVGAAMQYRFKDGSSQYWSAIQVRGHRYPIAKLEAKLPSDQFAAIARADYNYFVAPDSMIGAGPFTFRITDVRGQVVEDTGVMLGDAVTRTGTAQFPTCE